MGRPGNRVISRPRPEPGASRGEPHRNFVDGANLFDLERRAAVYVDKILKGAKPGDLPVKQPAKLELVVNRRAAGAIGLAIPLALLQRADRVID